MMNAINATCPAIPMALAASAAAAIPATASQLATASDAIPERVTPQEQARYNYRALQVKLSGYGWKHDKADNVEIRLNVPVDKAGLFRLDGERTPYTATITAYGDQFGWMISAMECAGITGLAAAYFTRTAVSITAPAVCVQTGSWREMAAPLTSKTLYGVAA